MTVIESLSYGIARGAVRAWFDVQDERKKLEREKIIPEDEAHIARFSDAVRDTDRSGVFNSSGDSGRVDPASTR